MLEKGSAKGGASLLMRTPTVMAAPAYKAMSCAKCTDIFVALPDNEPKGAGAKALLAAELPTKIVAKHRCETCANEWKTVGQGKAKRDVAKHTCNSCVSESLACCSTRNPS